MGIVLHDHQRKHNINSGDYKMPEETETSLQDKAHELDMHFCNHAPVEKINQFFAKIRKILWNILFVNSFFRLH